MRASFAVRAAPSATVRPPPPGVRPVGLPPFIVFYLTDGRAQSVSVASE